MLSAKRIAAVWLGKQGAKKHWDVKHRRRRGIINTVPAASAQEAITKTLQQAKSNPRLFKEDFRELLIGPQHRPGFYAEEVTLGKRA